MQVKIVTVDVRLSENTKRAIRWVLLPIAVGMTSGAVAYAWDTSWIKSGAPISASALQSTLNDGLVPSGAVMFFNLSVCPAGWTGVSAAQGRYLVGLPSSGTLAGTAGTALSDEENRSVGQHTHGASDSGHAHGVGGGQYYAYFNASSCSGSNLTSAAGSQCFDAVGSTGTGYANVAIANAGSVAGTNAPYVQYLVCQKN